MSASEVHCHNNNQQRCSHVFPSAQSRGCTREPKLSNSEDNWPTRYAPNPSDMACHESQISTSRRPPTLSRNLASGNGTIDPGSSAATFYTSREFHESPSISTTASPIKEEPMSSPRSHLYGLANTLAHVQSNAPKEPLDKFIAQQSEVLDIHEGQLRAGINSRRLRALRLSVMRLRNLLRTKHQALLETESIKIAADEDFMRYIRRTRLAMQSNPPIVDLMSLQSKLEPFFGKMQDARDVYGPLEYEYKALEEQLDQKEFEILRLEGQLYPLDERPATRPATSGTAAHATSEASFSSDPDSLLGISTNFHKEYHEYHASYLSRLGDLDLAKEQLEGLVEENNTLIDVKMAREKLGLRLQDEDTEFLQNFPNRVKAFMSEILHIEEDVRNWRSKCLAEGIDLGEDADIDIEARVHDATLREVFEEEASETNAALQSTPAASTFSESALLHQLLPDEIRDDIDLVYSSTNSDESNKIDRINRWILYRLMTSRIEVDLLLRVFDEVAKSLDFGRLKTNIHRWQEEYRKSVRIRWDLIASSNRANHY